MTVNKPGKMDGKATPDSSCGEICNNQTGQLLSAPDLTHREAKTSRRRSPSPFAMHPLRENTTIHSRFHHGHDGEILGAEYWASPSDELNQDSQTYFSQTTVKSTKIDTTRQDTNSHDPGTSDGIIKAEAAGSENDACGESEAQDSAKGTVS